MKGIIICLMFTMICPQSTHASKQNAKQLLIFSQLYCVQLNQFFGNVPATIVSNIAKVEPHVGLILVHARYTAMQISSTIFRQMKVLLPKQSVIFVLRGKKMKWIVLALVDLIFFSGCAFDLAHVNFEPAAFTICSENCSVLIQGNSLLAETC